VPRVVDRINALTRQKISIFPSFQHFKLRLCSRNGCRSGSTKPICNPCRPSRPLAVSMSSVSAWYNKTSETQDEGEHTVLLTRHGVRYRGFVCKDLRIHTRKGKKTLSSLVCYAR